jgi:hypothetical protein
LKVNQLMNVTRLFWLLAVSAAAFAPLLLFLVNGADFSGVANESLGYRFFYCMRLYAGPDLTAWLPQGHLVTTLEHAINYFVLPTLDGSPRAARASISAMAFAFLIATAISRPFDTVIWWAAKSSKVADEQWRFFQDGMTHAGANGVRYYIPNNNYQYSDVFIMLLKGASNFATSDVTGGGRWIMDKYAPGLSFVLDREQSGLESIPANSTVVWSTFRSWWMIEPDYSAYSVGACPCRRTGSHPRVKSEGMLRRDMR